MRNFLSAFLLFTIHIFIFSCKKKTVDPVLPTAPTTYYYPPLTGDTWETISPTTIGWDENKLNEAMDFAASKSSYGIVILKKGRIVTERYWNGWNKDTKYYIASAGKSVTAFLAGMAQQDGIININNKTSQYIGTGWSSAPLAKENLITVRHHLSMTTGLDDNVPDQDCVTPACLNYKADAGTRWAYHNAAYYKLQEILSMASGKTINQYTKEKLYDKIGMPNAFWLNKVMYCTTREAARFGSLICSKGSWNGTALLSDMTYFNAMTSTSQNLNLSYGYLWWLNGKASSMVPGLQTVFPIPLNTSAPADMYMALGKDDKKIYVVPSLDVVVVRLGDDAGANPLGPSSFDTELWGKLKLAMKY
jgi:CubicO group peptidase (beta-lactamase class C family)